MWFVITALFSNLELWNHMSQFESRITSRHSQCDIIPITVKKWSWAHCARKSSEAVSDLMKQSEQGLPDCLFLLPLMSQTRPASIVLDIGANIGGCSALLAKAGFRVVAFEPIVSNAIYITKTKRLNNLKNLKIVSYALGKRTEYMTMVSQKGNYGNSQIVSNTNKITKDHDMDVMVNPNKVQTLRLDDILFNAKPGDIPFMKLDVQGYETNILHGGNRTLKRGVVGSILFECEDVRLVSHGSSPINLFETLVNFGFVIVSLHGKIIRDSKRMVFLCGERVRSHFGSINLYAVHKYRRAELLGLINYLKSTP